MKEGTRNTDRRAWWERYDAILSRVRARRFFVLQRFTAPSTFVSIVGGVRPHSATPSFSRMAALSFGASSPLISTRLSSLMTMNRGSHGPA